jgi:hypothetical protein
MPDDTAIVFLLLGPLPIYTLPRLDTATTSPVPRTPS